MRSPAPRAALLLAAVALATPATAAAQSFGVSGGVSLLESSSVTRQSPGWHLQGSFAREGVWRDVGVRLDALLAYNPGRLREPYRMPYMSSYDDAVVNLGLSAAGVYRLRRDRAVRPYLLGGVGIYGWDSATAFRTGVNGGAGVDFTLGRVRTFAEARLHAFLRDERQRAGGGQWATLAPLSFGVRF
jgi:hypothetical protein